MKILYLGQIGPGQTARMRMRALERLGHDVFGVNTGAPWQHVSWRKRQMQRRLGFGSAVDVINKSVLDAAHGFRPDIVWADKQEFLHSETLRTMHGAGAWLIHFTPDPYFSLPWKRTRLMDSAIRSFDTLVYCKRYEREQYEALGKQSVYMPLGYCDEVHRPLRSDDLRWHSVIGFLGGWEPRREQLLHGVAQNVEGLKIWGENWDFLRDGRWTLRRYVVLRQLAGEKRFRMRRDPLLGAALQGHEVYDDDYARALSGARIGLGFLRKVCPDQHTTRTFEIPACGSMLLADRTAEHLEFFEEGRQAEFFSSAEELTDKAKFYSANDAARQKIAEAGYRRSVNSKYAYIHRLAAVLKALGE